MTSGLSSSVGGKSDGVWSQNPGSGSNVSLHRTVSLRITLLILCLQYGGSGGSGGGGSGSGGYTSYGAGGGGSRGATVNEQVRLLNCCDTMT